MSDSRGPINIRAVGSGGGCIEITELAHCGNGAILKLIPALVNASSMKAVALADGPSGLGMIMPNQRSFPLPPRKPTVHSASLNAMTNCPAYFRDSESPFRYSIQIDPGFFLSSEASFWTVSKDSILHANRALSLSVSKRASAAAFSAFATRSFASVCARVARCLIKMPKTTSIKTPSVTMTPPVTVGESTFADCHLEFWPRFQQKSANYQHASKYYSPLHPIKVFL